MPIGRLALSSVVFANRFPRRRMPLRVGGKTIFVEVASTKEEVRKGLSGRQSLGENEGMLFVMSGMARHPFWMQGTTVPLSIAFVSDDGVIQEIRDMEPLSEEHVVPVQPSRIALETRRDWFARRGIGVGAVVSLA